MRECLGPRAYIEKVRRSYGEVGISEVKIVRKRVSRKEIASAKALMQERVWAAHLA